MRDQTAREPKFPVACARCGGRISEPVAFCPHCGAHARFALAGSSGHARSMGQAPRGSAASARAEPRAPSYGFAGDLDPPWPGPPTPLFASPDGDPYGEVRAPNGRGWGLKTATIWVVAAFVILYAGAVAVHRFDGASSLPLSGSSKSVEGTIASNGGNDSTFAAPAGRNAHSSSSVLQPPAPVGDNAAPTPTPTPTPTPAPALAPIGQSARLSSAPGNGASSDGGPGNGANDAYANGLALSHAGRSAQASPSGSEVANAQRQYRAQRSEAQSGRAAADRALNSAQAQFAKNELRGARASLDRALAADPSNGEALGLHEALVSREQERDASLSAARACVVQERWTCVWHNAGKALAADASSTEARALVDRAIVESGAATAPAGPGPDNVQVPMSK